MNGFHADIEKETLENTNFRKVLYTGTYQQLVVMSLQPGEDIGKEVHHTVDQFFRVEQGEAMLEIDGETLPVKADEVFIVPAGSEHNVTNISEVRDLKLYTIYAPPNHPDGTIHVTKEEAMAAEEHEHH